MIVPGFLNDRTDYTALVQDLRARGYYAAVAPIRWYNWLPCVGGRSVRPILDRIEHTVNWMLVAQQTGEPLPADPAEPLGSLPYDLNDWLTEMGNAAKGACHRGQRQGQSARGNLKG